MPPAAGTGATGDPPVGRRRSSALKEQSDAARKAPERPRSNGRRASGGGLFAPTASSEARKMDDRKPAPKAHAGRRTSATGSADNARRTSSSGPAAQKDSRAEAKRLPTRNKQPAQPASAAAANQEGPLLARGAGDVREQEQSKAEAEAVTPPTTAPSPASASPPAMTQAPVAYAPPSKGTNHTAPVEQDDDSSGNFRTELFSSSVMMNSDFHDEIIEPNLADDSSSSETNKLLSQLVYRARDLQADIAADFGTCVPGPVDSSPVDLFGEEFDIEAVLGELRDCVSHCASGLANAPVHLVPSHPVFSIDPEETEALRDEVQQQRRRLEQLEQHLSGKGKDATAAAEEKLRLLGIEKTGMDASLAAGLAKTHGSAKRPEVELLREAVSVMRETLRLTKQQAMCLEAQCRQYTGGSIKTAATPAPLRLESRRIATPALQQSPTTAQVWRQYHSVPLVASEAISGLPVQRVRLQPGSFGPPTRRGYMQVGGTPVWAYQNYYCVETPRLASSYIESEGQRSPRVEAHSSACGSVPTPTLRVRAVPRSPSPPSVALSDYQRSASPFAPQRIIQAVPMSGGVSPRRAMPATASFASMPSHTLSTATIGATASTETLVQPFRSEPSTTTLAEQSPPAFAAFTSSPSATSSATKFDSARQPSLSSLRIERMPSPAPGYTPMTPGRPIHSPRRGGAVR